MAAVESCETECAEILCQLSEVVQTTEDSSSFKNSCTSPQEFEGPESSGKVAFPATKTTKRSGGSGGFTCCVPGCYSNNKRNRELSFYNFPNGRNKESEELRKKWINLVSRKDFAPTSGHRVCSLHFPGGRKTYSNRLPTLVPKATRPTPAVSRPNTKARNRTPLLSRTNDRKRSRTCLSELEAEDNHVSSGEQDDSISREFDENNSNAENHDPVALLHEEMAELRANNEKLRRDNQNLRAENEQQKAEIKLLQEQLEEQQKGQKFSVDIFKSNDKLFRFFAGLADYETFKNLFDSFGAVVNKLVYYGSNTNTARIISKFVQKRGPKRGLTPEQEFFLVLVRLRLGLLEEDLATRAGLSQSQMSRIFITWIDFLHSRLRSYPIWPSKESVRKTMPNSFREMYPSTRIVIDCTEIFIEMPSSFRSQSVTYSNYKHHNTAKGLVGISPAGAVIFVSDLYAGRSSDKQITKDCGVLDLLEAGDSVMADKGFDIENDLPEGVSLNIPPFLRDKEYLSIEEETETRRIASVRIHVERAIARIKNFRILSSVFLISMAADLNKIWVICCYLCNFLPALIAEKNK